MQKFLISLIFCISFYFNIHKVHKEIKKVKKASEEQKREIEKALEAVHEMKNWVDLFKRLEQPYYNNPNFKIKIPNKKEEDD